MFRFFSPSRRTPTLVCPRFGRLLLERLEERDCPVIPALTLSATVLSGHVVQLSGTVTADQPQGVTVTFNGAASGSTTTGAGGAFLYTTGGASLGQVSAVATDQQAQVSPPATANIMVTAPTITLNVTYNTQRSVTLWGQITGVDAGSRTVTFTGVATGSVTSNSDGTFSYTTTATALGNVSAQTTDTWSQSSNTPQVTLVSAPPQITNFVATHITGNVWTFSGTVTDESFQGLTVALSGTPTLNGEICTVGSSGLFYTTLTLQNGEDGTACAQTIDWWAQSSNEALFTFHA